MLFTICFTLFLFLYPLCQIVKYPEVVMGINLRISKYPPPPQEKTHSHKF